MRIFSNFDTRYKQKTIATYKQQFGDDKVFSITQSSLFFYVKIFIPLLFYICASILFVYGMYVFLGSGALFSVLTWIIVFGLVVILFPILKKYIDYKMDFILITPKFLVRYNQEGVFKRLSKTISARNIRTIAVKKTWIIYSIFNNGDLIFLSEGGGGDEMEGKSNMWSNIDIGEVVFTYVSKPEKMRRMIIDIMELVQ